MRNGTQGLPEHEQPSPLAKQGFRLSSVLIHRIVALAFHAREKVWSVLTVGLNLPT